MSRRPILAMMSFLSIAVAGTPAVAQSQATQGAPPTSDPSSPATPSSRAEAGIGRGSMTAGAYATNAALGDLYEIQSSRLAQQKSRSSAIRSFADQMIADHTATTAQLKATLAKANIAVKPPAQLDSRRQNMLDQLTRASGAEFDKLYLDQQTLAHQEALSLHSDYARSGESEPLKALAAATAPKIQHHFDMVKKLGTGGTNGSR